MCDQWHTARSTVRSSTKVGGSNHCNGSVACGRDASTLCVVGCVVFILLSSGCGNKNVSAAAPPPPNVQVVEVIQRDVPVYHEWIATLDGYVNAQIQPLSDAMNATNSATPSGRLGRSSGIPPSISISFCLAVM